MNSEVECDSCCATLEGARVLCMDCHCNETLDLCPEPECLDSVVAPKRLPGLVTPHTPNHDVLKVNRILFGRDTTITEQNAKDALVAARNTISDLMAEKKPMPGCICCRNVISLPCWYCVDCTGEFTQNPSKISPPHVRYFLRRGEVHLRRLRV